MRSHVARRAGYSLLLKGHLEVAIRHGPAVGAPDLAGLLGQWRVAGVAEEGRGGILLDELDRLAEDTWTHGLGVEARLPVLVLRGMAGAAALGAEGCLQG